MNKAAGLSGQTAGSVREMGRYVLGVISLAVSGLRGAARQVGGEMDKRQDVPRGKMVICERDETLLALVSELMISRGQAILLSC